MPKPYLAMQMDAGCGDTPHANARAVRVEPAGSLFRSIEMYPEGAARYLDDQNRWFGADVAR
ncbi:hypothetical protein ACGYWN_01705 [Burkholderia pseudomallei]|nr:hypothetical protein [Burkholderia pseudomallei]KIX62620.1 hypothetical protein SZ31_07040 [Burkholderia pseudomallei]MCW0097738.1 hypothetical protein [Burkholderia pseudomallei]MDV2107391.1 hypothetical protein [Burkholderia pseudomallei]MDV2148268.1 hypothetical protein [Burkholderia pseudomallei]MDV2203517.1 hypothetical protein [Burkholderia pseudomallei]